MEFVILRFLIFMVYAVLGWCMEVVISFLSKKRFVNRGFLIGPICPIYGWGCTLVVLLLSKYTNDLVTLFVNSIVICGVLEYFTSYLMEKLFNIRWWDYSKKKFNINGRVCLETLVPFGILASLIVVYVDPFFTRLFVKIDESILLVFSIIIFIAYMIDNILSFKIINDVKKTIKIKNRYFDRTEEISKKVRNILMKRGILHRRILSAFPNSKIKK